MGTAINILIIVVLAGIECILRGGGVCAGKNSRDAIGYTCRQRASPRKGRPVYHFKPELISERDTIGYYHGQSWIGLGRRTVIYARTFAAAGPSWVSNRKRCFIRFRLRSGFSALTFLHISAGELAPKWTAIQKPLANCALGGPAAAMVLHRFVSVQLAAESVSAVAIAPERHRGRGRRRTGHIPRRNCGCVVSACTEAGRSHRARP